MPGEEKTKEKKEGGFSVMLLRVGAAGAAAAGAAVGLRRLGGGWDPAAAATTAVGRLGPWAAPAYVAAHTACLALCLPNAVLFEAAAPLLFGFLPGVLCVFVAKVLAASLSFSIGRALFRSSKSAMEWVQRNKYFNLLVRGVEQDGWRFVLLARFSPLPSYVINYALAATNVNFLVDFLFQQLSGAFR
uniref:VTT domain-containing protein n=1 Tax=Ananas comosus var. bracteatus TaxID=296719 RepID=A0A6V7PT48_ANACO|nr:unnamed protein product [Ananas comosus var. bracteatus]